MRREDLVGHNEHKMLEVHGTMVCDSGFDISFCEYEGSSLLVKFFLLKHFFKGSFINRNKRYNDTP